MDPDCRLCTTAAAVDPADVVVRGTRFTAATGMGVPGWVLLWAHRHEAQGLWALSDAECQEVGPLLRDLAGAVRVATGAERTYLMSLGEHALHFHLMVMARTPDTPEPARGPALLSHAAQLADPDAARRLAGLIRQELAHAGRDTATGKGWS